MCRGILIPKKCWRERGVPHKELRLRREPDLRVALAAASQRESRRDSSLGVPQEPRDDTDFTRKGSEKRVAHAGSEEFGKSQSRCT
jgi:hypothetical protein